MAQWLGERHVEPSAEQWASVPMPFGLRTAMPSEAISAPSASRATSASGLAAAAADAAAAVRATRQLGGALAEDACICGNVFLEDSLYCRKCGRRRPEAPQTENGSHLTGSIRGDGMLKDRRRWLSASATSAWDAQWRPSPGGAASSATAEPPPPPMPQPPPPLQPCPAPLPPMQGSRSRLLRMQDPLDLDTEGASALRRNIGEEGPSDSGGNFTSFSGSAAPGDYQHGLGAAGRGKNEHDADPAFAEDELQSMWSHADDDSGLLQWAARPSAPPAPPPAPALGAARAVTVPGPAVWPANFDQPVTEIWDTDEVQQSELLEYSKALARKLSKGFPVISDAVLGFMHSKVQALHDGHVLQSNFAPFELTTSSMDRDEAELIIVQISAQRKGNLFHIAYRCRSSFLPRSLGANGFKLQPSFSHGIMDGSGSPDAYEPNVSEQDAGREGRSGGAIAINAAAKPRVEPFVADWWERSPLDCDDYFFQDACENEALVSKRQTPTSEADLLLAAMTSHDRRKPHDSGPSLALPTLRSSLQRRMPPEGENVGEVSVQRAANHGEMGGVAPGACQQQVLSQVGHELEAQSLPDRYAPQKSTVVRADSCVEQACRISADRAQEKRDVACESGGRAFVPVGPQRFLETDPRTTSILADGRAKPDFITEDRRATRTQTSMGSRTSALNAASASALDTKAGHVTFTVPRLDVQTPVIDDKVGEGTCLTSSAPYAHSARTGTSWWPSSTGGTSDAGCASSADGTPYMGRARSADIHSDPWHSNDEHGASTMKGMAPRMGSSLRRKGFTEVRPSPAEPASAVSLAAEAAALRRENAFLRQRLLESRHTNCGSSQPRSVSRSRRNAEVDSHATPACTSRAGPFGESQGHASSSPLPSKPGHVSSASSSLPPSRTRSTSPSLAGKERCLHCGGDRSAAGHAGCGFPNGEVPPCHERGASRCSPRSGGICCRCGKERRMARSGSSSRSAGRALPGGWVLAPAMHHHASLGGRRNSGSRSNGRSKGMRWTAERS